jgi:hypothetical protein
MRLRILFVLLFRLALAGVVFSQDVLANPSGLYNPTASEYLQVLKDIQSRGDSFSTSFKDAIAMEVDWRYVQQRNLRFDDLYEFYVLFLNTDDKWAAVNRLRSPWLRALLELWLDEQVVDFDTERFFQHNDFSITVTPATFLDAAGMSITFYRLDVVMTYMHRESFFVRRDRNHYEILVLPVREFYADGELFFSPSETFPTSDNSRTSLPVWGFSHVLANNNSHHHGEFIVLTWRDNQFEVLVTIDFWASPYTSRNSLSFTDVDGDSMREIRHYQELSDNWYCNFTQITTYDYNPESSRLEQSARADFLPDDFGCFTRQAEEAMWVKNYLTAIEFYEQAMAQETLTENEQQLKPYVQVRQTLANILVSRQDEAQFLVNQLPHGQDGFVDTLIEAYQNNPQPLPVCQTIYDFVAENPYSIPSFGVTEEYTGAYIQGAYTEPGFFIDKAVCDLSVLIEQSLSSQRWTTDQTPLQHFEAIGLLASDYLTVDFDMDGQAEWLVWTSWGIDAIFLHPQHGVYRISYFPGSSDTYFRGADVRPPQLKNQYAVVTIPYKSGQVLVNVDLDSDLYAVARCPMCGGGPSIICSRTDYDEEHQALGDLAIWGMENGTLQVLFAEYYCGSEDIASLFPNGTQELHTSTSTWNESEFSTIVVPAVYNWNSNTMTYELPVTSTATPILPTATPQAVLPAASPEYHTVARAMYAHDFEVAIQMTDELSILADEVDLQPYYLRAVALEATNQTDRAINLYSTLAETVPDSAWGLLAALHLRDRSTSGDD